MDIIKHNREAWDRKVLDSNRWTLPADEQAIAKARAGNLEIVLTPTIPVPPNWFPELRGTRTLCLAGAGGQQAPLLAAAGADVTVFDNSPLQLQQDEKVADREQLSLKLVQGDMRDLSAFENEQFDFIFHPCSNSFVPELTPVWREAARVLRSSGVMLSGFTNSVRYIFDDERSYSGKLEVRHKLPYADLTHLTPEELKQYVVVPGHPFEFGHTLTQQIGEQLQSGFLMTDFYEDRYSDEEGDPISNYMDTFIATRTVRK